MQARQGQRQVLFLTGEPGIGKTAVVEAWTAQVRQDPAVWVATGQCRESYGLGEPYLPILEALGQLCRGPDGGTPGPPAAPARPHLAGAAALAPHAGGPGVLAARTAGDDAGADAARVCRTDRDAHRRDPAGPHSRRSALERPRHAGPAGAPGAAPRPGPAAAGGDVPPGRDDGAESSAAPSRPDLAAGGPCGGLCPCPPWTRTP